MRDSERGQRKIVNEHKLEDSCSPAFKQRASKSVAAFSRRSEWREWVLASGYLLACALPAVLALPLLRPLLVLVSSDQTFSHIPFAPMVSACFLFADRKRIFAGERRPSRFCVAVTVAGFAAVLLAGANPWHWGASNQISLLVLGFVLAWAGAFGIFFGATALRAARFPLLFLFFAIPIPEALLSGIVAFLQRGSADAVDLIFRLFHAPVARNGFEFSLPGVTIRIAEECSGIRSTLALVMTAALAGHLWLRSFPRTLLLCLAAIPIAILKNAIRIAVLSWLAVRVDPRFLTGSIHHQYGGAIFYGVGLAMLAGAIALLRKLPQDASQVPLGAYPLGRGARFNCDALPLSGPTRVR